MKTIVLSAILLLSISLSVRSQLTLNAGESFTYQFSSLPQLNDTPPFPRDAVYGESRALTLLIPPPGSFSFRLELFESGTNQAPVLSRTFITPLNPDPSDCCDFTGTARDTWQDLQGAVRISMISGSVTFKGLALFAQRPEGQYQKVVQLPVRRPINIEDYVPCSGPLSGGKWRNHGQYVSAVGAVVQEFIENDLLTEDEAEVIITTAARSDCGRK